MHSFKDSMFTLWLLFLAMIRWLKLCLNLGIQLQKMSVFFFLLNFHEQTGISSDVFSLCRSIFSLISENWWHLAAALGYNLDYSTEKLVGTVLFMEYWGRARLSSKQWGKQTLYVPAADSHRDYIHNIVDTDMELDIRSVQNFNLAGCCILVAF